VYFFAHVMAIVRSHPHDLMESWLLPKDPTSNFH
jgi:hypothetical protein